MLRRTLLKAVTVSKNRRRILLALLTLTTLSGYSSYLLLDTLYAADDADAVAAPLPVIAMPVVEIETDEAVVAPLPGAAVAETAPAQPREPVILAEGRAALLLSTLMLERGREKFSKMTAYTAKFFKRELVAGTMDGGQQMNIKIRHAPFSIYMKWLTGDKGREVLYVEGQNDGEMIVKMGGIKGRLLPAMKLDPYGSLALSKSRHPVTRLGLVNLADEVLIHRHEELQREPLACTCWMADHASFNERPCYCVSVEYPSPDIKKEYRKSVLLLDKEWMVPVSIQNYSWAGSEQADLTGAELDEATLIEHYGYSEINILPEIADAEFDRKNGDYNLRR